MFLKHEAAVLLCCWVLFGVALHAKEKGTVRVCVCVCVCECVCACPFGGVIYWSWTIRTFL